jgi:hypothetical protein
MLKAKIKDNVTFFEFQEVLSEGQNGEAGALFDGRLRGIIHTASRSGMVADRNV